MRTAVRTLICSPVLAADENGLSTSLSDYSGRPMSMLEGAIYAEMLEKNDNFTDHEDYHYFNNEIDAITAVQSGTVDAYINSYITMYKYLQEFDDLMIFPEAIDVCEYAFAFAKGDPLRDEFNAAKEEFVKSGGADELYEKWFNKV